MSIETWLTKNSFHCPTLHARLSPAQCQANRRGRRAMGHDGVGALEGCLKCRHWAAWQQNAGMDPTADVPLLGSGEMLPEPLLEPA